MIVELECILRCDRTFWIADRLQQAIRRADVELLLLAGVAPHPGDQAVGQVAGADLDPDRSCAPADVDAVEGWIVGTVFGLDGP